MTAGITPDGVVPKSVALQAFALTIGPIPGVKVPEGDVPIESGSASLRWISRYMDKVTPGQRDAIEQALAPGSPAPGSSTSVVGGPGKSIRRIFGPKEYPCTNNNDGVSADGEGAATYRPMLNEELAKVEAALGRPLGIPVHLTVGTSVEGRETLAWESPQSPDCTTQPATSCRVQILKDKMESAPPARAHRALAHELVHCFQATWMAAHEALRQPDWITEGFADFVGEDLNPGGPRINLKLYVTKPHDPLFQRDYEAQGFFFHLSSVGGDVYSRYRDAFLQRDSAAAFAYLTEPSGTKFSDTWASVLTHEPERGDAWYMPEAPIDSSPFYARKAIKNGSSMNLAAAPAATRLGHLDFDADVVRFAVSGGGHGRVGWDGGNDVTMRSVAGSAWCAKGGGCECPPGSTGAAPDSRIPSEGAMVTAAGMGETTTVVISGVSLEDFCTAACHVGTWTTEEWSIPGPTDALTATGGAGAVVRIRPDGTAEWSFDDMEPMAMHDPDIDLDTFIYSKGSATGRVVAEDGTWAVEEPDLSDIDGETQVSVGGSYPSKGAGAFVLIPDGTYTCEGDVLSYSAPHPTTGTDLTITLRRG